MEPFQAQHFDLNRPHRGQMASASALRLCLEGSTLVRAPVPGGGEKGDGEEEEEPAALRCIPQVRGAGGMCVCVYVCGGGYSYIILGGGKKRGGPEDDPKNKLDLIGSRRLLLGWIGVGPWVVRGGGRGKGGGRRQGSGGGGGGWHVCLLASSLAWAGLCFYGAWPWL